jgi:dolichol-phosphate mannosyltransferase
MNGQNKRKIVLIPTYNELENIQIIIPRIMVLHPDLEIWVIDDGSPDGTADAVRSLMRAYPKIQLIVREKKDGIGEAYKHALRIVQKQPDIAFIATMDADGSHEPAKLAELFGALAESDLAIGSRYVKGGGGMSDAGMYRSLLSQGGNLYARTILGHGIKDSTAGFVAFRHSALDGVDIDTISSSGYSYQIDFKNKLLEHGRTFVEIPISFPDRQIGVSKMSGRIVREAIVTPWKIAFRRISDRNRFLKTVFAGLAVTLFLFAAFAATYKITESPSVWYDEGIYMQLASNIAHQGVSGLRVSPSEVIKVPQLTVGYPLTGPLALVFKIWGDGVLQARLLMVLFILLFVASSYALVRRISGSMMALWALALLVSFAPLYGNGKSVLGEVPGLLFTILALLFLEYAKTAYAPKLWVILAGLSAGLAAATKPYFLIVPVAVVIALALRRKDHQLAWKDILVGIVAFVVPLGVWAFLQFGGAAATDTLSRYANPYQYGDIWMVVAKNIKGMFLGIGPLYLLAMTAAWIIALWLRRKHGERIGTAETAAFLFVIISIAAYLRTSGEYRYIFPAQAVALLFFGSSLARLAAGIPWQRAALVARAWLVPAIIVLLTAFGIYQIEFDSWIADSYDATKTAGWEQHFASLATSTPVFFYDTPEVAIFDRGTDYYQYLQPGPGLLVGRESLSALASGTPAEVIAVTDKLSAADRKNLGAYPRSTTFYKYSIFRKR